MSANSFFQLYKGGTGPSTANFSENETPPSNPSASILKKLESLPTPSEVANEESGSVTQSPKARSAASSFFTIPLRFFKLSTEKQITGKSDVDEDPNPMIEDIWPLHSISDESPLSTSEPQESHDTDSDNKSQNSSQAEYDPIYDTYITYINHFTENEGKESGNDAGDSTRSGLEYGTSTLRGQTDDSWMSESQLETGSKLLGKTKDVVLPHDSDGSGQHDTLSRKKSTLDKFKDKTRTVLKQISLYYNNEDKENKPPRIDRFEYDKPEVKRRLSIDSVRRWAARANGEFDNKGVKKPKAHTLHNVYRSSRNNSLSGFFQSKEFKSRLSSGTVKERRQQTDLENENENEPDISNKLGSEFFQLSSHPGSRQFGTQRLVTSGNQHFLHDKLSSLKQTTIRRSKSLQKLASRFRLDSGVY